MADQQAPKKKRADGRNADDVFRAPEILRQPASCQVSVGNRLCLRITAIGIPVPSYQWYLNGRKIVGANSDRLLINKTRRDHGGQYTCVAKNFVGSATSRAAVVSFLLEKVPNLVIEPSMAAIPVGKPFKFRLASPTGDILKRLKLQWLFNGRRIKDATGPELQFTQVKKKYEGEYKVIVLIAGEIRASNCVKLEAVPAEEPERVVPALTKEKTAFLEAPPPEEFFFDPGEEEAIEPSTPETGPGLPGPEEGSAAEAAETANVKRLPEPVAPAEKNRSSPGLARKKDFLAGILARLESKKMSRAA